MPEPTPEPTPDLNVNVTDRGRDSHVLRNIERYGLATVLLVVLGMYFLRQDAGRQSFVEKTAADSAIQAKLDRQEERLAAQRTQEELVKVITSQVTATVEQTAQARENKQTQEEVVEALNRFSSTTEGFVERLDQHLDNIDAEKP
jgi:response regulator of citrate/malate metabolism